jgi:ditrans,polycis-polyprenyl diphosphate synthase
MSLLQYALWLRDNAVDRIRRALLGVLKAGPIPHHVAFIMDGNRRYARDKGVKVLQGHVDGFVALRRVRAQPMHDHPCPPQKKNSFANFQS